MNPFSYGLDIIFRITPSLSPDETKTKGRGDNKASTVAVSRVAS